MAKLYVGNISWDTSEDALADCFRQYGDVLDAKIVTDRETGRSRGFGFVTMSSTEEARIAQEKLDGFELDGRPLRVNEAREREERGRGTGPRRGGGWDSGGRNDRGRRNGRRGRDY